jgi:hypothetical protein
MKPHGRLRLPLLLLLLLLTELACILLRAPAP